MGFYFLRKSIYELDLAKTIVINETSLAKKVGNNKQMACYHYLITVDEF
ncbi:MAG: hypothetical protein HUJ74_03145 [Lachnospiraceae bacterium]|nr:hypothetical protein [Lachnospiraceae bacterium]